MTTEHFPTSGIMWVRIRELRREFNIMPGRWHGNTTALLIKCYPHNDHTWTLDWSTEPYNYPTQED